MNSTDTKKKVEWDMKKSSLRLNGYYENWAYEYVKATIKPKILQEGIRDRQVLIQIYWNELGLIGRTKRMPIKTMIRDIRDYGINQCLQYWMDYYKLP